MNVDRIARQYAGRLTLVGTVGSAQLLDQGSVTDVRAAVRQRLSTWPNPSGLILAPAYDLLPETPYPNAAAFFAEALRPRASPT
jgi:uroporphyrinogen-III decarboxylase